MSSIPGTRVLTRRKIAAYSSGVVKPTVSGMLMGVAPAWTATVIILGRNSGWERVPSSVENSTSSVKERARRTDSAAWSRAWSRVMRSLYSRWRSEEAMTRWMRLEGAASTARAAASMSSRLQRASEAMRGPRPSRATARMAAKSPSEAMANPASRTSTPSAAIWWAKRSFSSWCMVQPGDCSPSRRVVSKKTIWFWFGLGIEFDPRFGRYSMVLGVAGEHAAFSKYGQPFKHSAVVLDQDDDYKWPAPAVATKQDVSAEKR